MERLYQIAQDRPQVVGGVLILLGTIFAFRGYPLFHASMRLYGALFGAAVFLAVQRMVSPDPPYPWVPYAYMGGGAVVGFLTIRAIYFLAVFSTAGVAASSFAGNALLGMDLPLWGYWLAVSLAGIVAGSVAVRVEKPAIVVATAVLGALLVGAGLAQFGYAALPMTVGVVGGGVSAKFAFTPLGTAMFGLLALAGVFAQWGAAARAGESKPAPAPAPASAREP